MYGCQWAEIKSLKWQEECRGLNRAADVRWTHLQEALTRTFIVSITEKVLKSLTAYYVALGLMALYKLVFNFNFLTYSFMHPFRVTATILAAVSVRPFWSFDPICCPICRGLTCIFNHCRIKGKERKSIYMVPLHIVESQSAQIWITQFYLQITPCLPFLRKCLPDGASTECGGKHLIAAHLSTPRGWKAELAWSVDL